MSFPTCEQSFIFFKLICKKKQLKTKQDRVPKLSLNNESCMNTLVTLHYRNLIFETFSQKKTVCNSILI